jgi:hypothetical protein
LHCVCVSRRHVPEKQHAPGCSHVFGVQVPPDAHVCALAPQSACAVIEHDPVTKLQHTPVGCGHGFGEHTVDAIHVVPPVHIACVSRRHEPSAVVQHAPDGSHGFGEHDPPLVHVCAPSPHAACSVREHDPLMKLQHRPFVAHGFGLHAPPCVHDPVHRLCVSRTHPPLVSQHEPVAGHVFGVHVPPTDHVLDAGGQSACSVR